MGLFSKSSKKENPMQEIMSKIFPKGKSDIITGTDELLNILDYTISKENAQNIFVKSMAISFLTREFDVERLKTHLDGYCKGVFSQDEIQRFYEYLIARKMALMMGGLQVRKDEKGNYCW